MMERSDTTNIQFSVFNFQKLGARGAGDLPGDESWK